MLSKIVLNANCVYVVLTRVLLLSKLRFWSSFNFFIMYELIELTMSWDADVSFGAMRDRCSCVISRADDMCSGTGINMFIF